MPRISFARFLIVAASLFLSIAMNAGARDARASIDAEATEQEPVIDAASLVQPALLSGPGFSVDPHVELRGYMGHFKLDTRFGPLTAESVAVLAERVAELPALEALEQATHSDAFIQAAQGKLVATSEALRHIVMHPVDTMLGLPAGVARYFGAQLKKYAGRAQRLSDRAARKLGTDGDPYPSDEGPMTDARDDAGKSAAGKPDKTWYTRIGRELEREVKRQLKYNQVKRELAARLGIDPHSGNPYIQQRLESLAWVGASGNYSATAALGAIGGVGATVLTEGGRVNEIVWKLSPDDLRERNNERLRAYCRDELLMRWFLRRGAFSPTLQTGLIDGLDALKPAAGGDALLELGMTANSPLEARFLVDALRMLAAHLGPRAHAGQLRPIGAGLVYVTADGALLLPLPVDRLSWTPEVRDFLDRSEFRVVEKTALIAGEASLAARRGLSERGWHVATHVQWPASPPYARADEPTAIDVED